MRILILPSWYPTPKSPVNGIFIQQQADALSKDHLVRVIYLDMLPRHYQAKPTRSVSNVRGYPEEIIEVPSKPIVWRLAYLWNLTKAYRRINKHFAPQVIHAHVAFPAGWAAVLLGHFARVPVVITENSSTFEPWLKRTTWQVMARQAFRRADVIIAVSEGLKQRIIHTFGRKRRVVVIPNIVDTRLFTATPFPTTDSGYRLLFVGLMDTTQKGIHMLLEALAKVKQMTDVPVRVDLVGDGILRTGYEEQAGKLGLGEMVVFHGIQPHESIAKMLSESHALVLPSLHEALPLAIIESFASGRPVISTRCGGPEFMVNSTNGLIVEPGQAGPLAEAITNLLGHLGNYDPKAIARAADNLYSYRAVTDSLTELYGQMLRQANRKK